jgi:ectoine hydroxylase-related dioxygenase (phytanoyl-CoA dioxygenase family)
MLQKAASYRLTEPERQALDRDGYVVRHQVFDADECRIIAGECEDLLSRLEAAKRSEKHVVGSYIFELGESGCVLKWEPDNPDVIMGIEPFAHICKPLEDWGLDPRLTDPCKDLVGEDEVILFTEKLNVKRAKAGGPIVLHQDYPYWETHSPVAHRVATAMVFLDDANLTNGCLEVAPGSHTVGKHPQKKVEGFGAMEMDQSLYDESQLVPLEVKAGTVAFFGPFLVHRSAPNRSGVDRRALLYSYQPPGNPHGRDYSRARRAKEKQGEDA